MLHVVSQSVCQQLTHSIMASNFDLGNYELGEEISLSDLMLMPTQNLVDVKKDDQAKMFYSNVKCGVEQEDTGF